MKTKLFSLTALLAPAMVLALSFALALAGCNTDGGGKPAVEQAGETFSVTVGEGDSAETYTLTITPAGKYELKVTPPPEGKRSSGTAAKSGDMYTLTPSNAADEPFTVTVGGNAITGMEGTITFTNNTTAPAPTIGGPTTYTYTDPGNQSAGGVTASVTFSPASPQPATTSVTATVSFTGAADANRVFTLNLTSTKAALNGEAKKVYVVSGEKPAEQTFSFTVPSRNVDDFVLTFTSSAVNRNASGSIKTTFGITGGAAAATVSEVFNTLHIYISSRTAAQLASDGIIQKGDYIDLEGGLAVAAYNGLGDFSVANTELTGHGTLLRLIVVGINSFNGKNGNGDAAHIVFQFRNAPVTRRMESWAGNTNGYAGSEMRKYLAPTGDSGSGNFLTGLTNAGVPDSVLWAPLRKVANKGAADGTHDVQDKLWLPTEREMFGNGPYTNASGPYSNTTYETAENQARLEYYTDDARRKKYDSGNAVKFYWTASPKAGSSNAFCTVADDYGAG